MYLVVFLLHTRQGPTAPRSWTTTWRMNTTTIMVSQPDMYIQALGIDLFPICHDRTKSFMALMALRKDCTNILRRTKMSIQHRMLWLLCLIPTGLKTMHQVQIC